ncbi:hypothetical protein SAY86_021771 [Trapa natans]|uniref:non-specific serine/threonine protein kinase n=1 Tax=Trapa natans TaxID=22666 RepID=A0AAN7MAB0_TRANT|nr:hypothetical protein SAY86_021771 [Trapa natans]
MGICWGDPRFPTPSHTGSLKSGIQLTISSSSSSGDGHHHNNLVLDDIGPFPNGSILADPCLKNFTLQELTAATENFRSDLLIGEGGFGQVYRGFISEGVALGGKKTVVAIKTQSGESMQGYREWMAEVQFLGTLSHPNIVKLLGFCSNDGQLLLVYEYMSRGSLNNHLYEKRSKDHPLSWASRLKIALGAARGMEFLHSSERAIIYRDFKSSNILLDRVISGSISSNQC